MTSTLEHLPHTTKEDEATKEVNDMERDARALGAFGLTAVNRVSSPLKNLIYDLPQAIGYADKKAEARAKAGEDEYEFEIFATD